MEFIKNEDNLGDDNIVNFPKRAQDISMREKVFFSYVGPE